MICPVGTRTIGSQAAVGVIRARVTVLPRALWLARAVAVASLLTMLAFTARPGTARAADDPAAVEARKHYEEGTKAFNLGEYARAITEFKATYYAKPDPLLLYNIAQSFRLAGDAKQALFFYKSFLRNMPNPPNRKEVELRMRALEKQIAEAPKDAAKDATTTPGPAEPAAGAAGATATGIAPPPSVATPPTAAGTPAPATGTPPEPSDATATAPTTPPSTSPPPPPVPSAATTTAPGAELGTPGRPAGDEGEDRPIYKKWWFWTGAVAVAAVVVIGIGASNAAHKAPSTTLGTYDPTFK